MNADQRPTPETDAEEAKQSKEYDQQRECGWPPFFCDFSKMREIERQRDETLEMTGRLAEHINKWPTSLDRKILADYESFSARIKKL